MIFRMFLSPLIETLFDPLALCLKPDETDALNIPCGEI